MQKILPFLWFDNQLEEAANFYTTVFPNSEIHNMTKLAENTTVGSFRLEDLEFMGMNAGPQFKFNPSISFAVACKTADETDSVWNKLSEGGEIMMEYNKYPFAEKYGWCNDKFGVSWQVMQGDAPQKITPSFLFVKENFGKVEEAIKFYTSLFKNSSIGELSRYDDSDPMGQAGKINHANFNLDGVEFVAMESNMDHKFSFNEAISLYVNCDGQEEVDHFWNNMVKGGGEESMCGWLKDKYGISWQIIPKQLIELQSDSDPIKVQKVVQCMLGQKKIIVEDLKKAYDGE